MDSCKKIYLCNTNLDKICVLNGVQTSSVSCTKRTKDYSSLSFNVDRYIIVNGKPVQSNGYDLLDIDMYLYLEDIGYFKMQYPSMENDGKKEFKIINASSIEQEFYDKDWVNFKCNTGEKDSLEQLVENNLNDLGFAKEFIVFYNPKKPQLSLLHIILQKMNGWNVESSDIDPKLWDVKLSISETQSVDLYDLLTSVIAPKANCLFIFDILNRKLKAIHKDSLNDKKYDTNIFIGYRNLAKTIDVTVDEDSIYTAFNCSGNDDLTINDWNYNSSTIFNFDYFLSEKRVPKQFIDKVKKWEKWRNDNRQHFADLSKQRADKNEKIYQLKYKVPNDALDWKQWDKMEEEMLKENQKYYQTLLTSLQVSVDDNPQYTQDEFGNKVYISWKKPNGETDHERYLEKLHALENGYGGYYTYIEIVKYILPNIQIAFDNLGVESDKKKDYITDFETDWDLYGIEELKSKKKDYENRLEALKKYEKPWSELSSEEKVNYPGGEPEYNKLGHTEFTIIKGYIGSESTSNTLLFQLKQLNLELDKLNSALKIIDSERNDMISQSQINHSLYGMNSNDLIVFYRLQKYKDYQNENIMSTSVDTTVSIIDREKELFDDSTNKLIEVSQPQFTFHTQLDNLLRLKEFELWADDLELLNFIRLGIRDDYSVKLRIIEITWNPCEITPDLEIEFSNMITAANGRNDLTHLLSNENNRGSKNSYSFGTGNSKSEQEYLTKLLQLMINNNLFHQAVGNIAGNTNGVIDNIEVGNIVAEYLKVTKIDVNKITGDEADFNKLFADYIDAEFITTELIKANEGIFKNLNADTGFIKHLQSEIINADSIVTELIKADEGVFKNLTADTGFIKHLQSEIIDTSVINADIANIKQLLAGFAGIGDLQSIHLTAKNVIIDKAVIKELIAAQMTVADLMTQKATAQMITLISSDGKPSIAFQNSTQQFYDNQGNVRVQIGQDGNNNFNFVVRGEDGTTALFDNHGIKKDGIPDNTIVNNMIEDQAISKDKLNFPIIEPNKQGGVDITQIYDGSGNKWGIEYYSFKESVNSQLSDLGNRIDSSDTYILYIETPNGNKMIPGGIEFHAHLFKNSVDVTHEWNNKFFTWTRHSSDTYGDTYWNDKHKDGTKILRVLPEDIKYTASFQCKFEAGDILVTSHI